MLSVPDTTLFPFSLRKGNVVDVIYLGSIIPDIVWAGNGYFSRRMQGWGDSDTGVFYRGSVSVEESCSMGFIRLLSSLIFSL